MTRNPNITKFRIKSSRLRDWDYSLPGYYFVTLCTKDKKCIFGNIMSGKMVLSPVGGIIDIEWRKSFQIRKELECIEYSIMPNHVHGIICLKDLVVETHGRASLRFEPHGSAYRSPKSISSFIAGFKSSVTMRVNNLNNSFCRTIWQERFYDHIIRNEKELIALREYVQNNPLKWELDEYYATGSSRPLL